MCKTKQYRHILDPLIQYSYEKCGGDFCTINQNTMMITYATMIQAIADLDNKNRDISEDAEQYFQSETFDRHCEVVGITPELVLSIVENRDKVLVNCLPYGTDYSIRNYESYK